MIGVQCDNTNLKKMADPKYASLPGIDLDQPDVYETTELPEAEQETSDDADSESVEKLSVSVSEAFNNFRGKTVDGANIDFSGQSSRRRQTGYRVPQLEYEMVGDGCGVKETPQQKYQRLQHEMRELAAEVDQIKKSVASDASSDAASSVAVATQVEYLQRQLTDLHLEQLVGPDAGGAASLADPQGALQKRLLSEIANFKPAKSGGKAGAAPPGGSTGATAAGDHVTYELYYRPEQAQYSSNAKTADLEGRLERLEALLGHSSEKMSALTAETDNKSLLGAVSLLSSRVRLLDASQLSEVEARLHALSVRLAHIAEKKKATEDADKQTKVTELYELVRKWDGMANSLPHVVERLLSLKQLHEQALQFSQALTHLDTTQQQISGCLVDHTDMLKQLKTTLSQNMAIVKANCDSIDARMKAVKK